MAHFATLKDIKVDVRVTFMFYTDTDKKKIDTAVLFRAVGIFVRNWGAYLDDWELKPSEDMLKAAYSKAWRFTANLENVPALQFGNEVSQFIRNADNWERGKDFDKWWFAGSVGLEIDLADYFFNEFATWCGLKDPEKLGYDDTGYECECRGCYVTEMTGFVPIADDESLSEWEEKRLKEKA